MSREEYKALRESLMVLRDKDGNVLEDVSATDAPLNIVGPHAQPVASHEHA